MANDTKSFSSKQEKLVAQELNGKTVSGSGARPGHPGDVITERWLIECKTHTTPNKSIAFNDTVWKKIKDEAFAMHRKPLLVVDDGSQSLSKTWCLCLAMNINLSRVVTVDFPVSIRKNISCKHDKLKSTLKDSTKQLVSESGFYNMAAYELTWCEDTVVVMPLSQFKELFED